jgi:hypothetical protein
MSSYRFSVPRIMSRRMLGCLLAMLVLVAVTAFAAETTVRALVDRRISVIGDPITLQIKVVGARRPGNPPDIAVDGLDIGYGGESTSASVRIDNGIFTSEKTTTWVYQVVAQRNGKFTIPAQTIQADGKTFRTEDISLTIQPSSAGDNDNENEKMSFAEFVIPKKTLFLGEAVPVEMKLYVDSKVRWQPVTMPEIEGDGFTKQKMPEPRNEQVTKDGKDYDVLIFRTVITPIRAGKLTLGPSEIHFKAVVPRARRGGQRGIFDDVFNDPFFSTTQEFKTKAAAVELTVKPLPQNGKPADFSGAVGNFQFSAEGSPKQVKIGDPVTMKLRISGRGNFDRVNVPQLADPAGWRTYPPSSTFQADDPVNYSGTKTFEMAVIPEAKKSAMPVFHFSYFDPVAEKYVTLKSEPAALTVEGDTLPAPKPVVTNPDTSAPEPPKPAAEQRPDDILGLRYEQDAPATFAPLYERREFWYAQGGVALLFLGLIVFKARRKPSADAQQRAALRQEKEAMWRRLRSGDLGHVDFFDAAARLAQLQTALATGKSVGSIDVGAVRAAANLDESAGQTIEEIFSARAEMHYAGGGSNGGTVSAADRERVIGALKQLEKGYANS